MGQAQRGIFSIEQPFHHHLEFRVRDDVSADAVVSGIRKLYELRSALAEPERPVLVIGFGDGLWRTVSPSQSPEKLTHFTPIGRPGGRYAPATQQDLWLWISSPRIDINLELALAAVRKLSETMELKFEVQGFSYRDHRDLMGFVDGTANPKTEALRRAAALIPDGAVGAGGSYVFTQNWIHHLNAFLNLPVTEQEQVIGRTKTDDIELEGDAQPPDSHVSRTDVSVDGVAMKIWRRSVVFGSAQRHGLHFVSFACDPARIDIQLQRMFGTTDDGVHDRLTDYSTPVTGSYWFAPAVEDLAAIFGIPAAEIPA